MKRVATNQTRGVGWEWGSGARRPKVSSKRHSAHKTQPRRRRWKERIRWEQDSLLCVDRWLDGCDLSTSGPHGDKTKEKLTQKSQKFAKKYGTFDFIIQSVDLPRPALSTHSVSIASNKDNGCRRRRLHTYLHRMSIILAVYCRGHLLVFSHCPLPGEGRGRGSPSKSNAWVGDRGRSPRLRFYF